VVSNQRMDVVVIDAAPPLFACIERDVVPVEVGVDAAGRVAGFEEQAKRFGVAKYDDCGWDRLSRVLGKHG